MQNKKTIGTVEKIKNLKPLNLEMHSDRIRNVGLFKLEKRFFVTENFTQPKRGPYKKHLIFQGNLFQKDGLSNGNSKTIIREV